MHAIRQVHWGRIVVAGFLSEVSIFVIFLLLLIGAFCRTGSGAISKDA